jgi:ribonuclease G
VLSSEAVNEAEVARGNGFAAGAATAVRATEEQEEAGEASEEQQPQAETEEPDVETQAIDTEAHPMPGAPQPVEFEEADAAPEEEDADQEKVGADATASGEDEQGKASGSARVRGRRGSERHLQRRGRRGRRSGRRSPSERGAEEPRAAKEADTAKAEKSSSEPSLIADMLSKGNEILVQISKEPLGKKGARITSHIALPGRFLVYMPTVDHVGVSRKISTYEERRRLRAIVQGHRTGMPGGFIVRTAGEGMSEEEIHGDMLFLYNLWLDIRQKAEHRAEPGLIHQDLDIVERILRDQLDEDFKTIWVDAEEEYERILRFVERFQPSLLSRVKLYTRPNPVFDEFNITKAIEKALRPKVWLKSGGYIVINQTEALVAVDVNTGKYVGKSDRLEDTIVNTNIEAAKEVVRQMRLRDLGGIIVVDFIDMEDRKNRLQVIQVLEKELQTDRAPSKSLPFNEFGLVALTRKRVKQSLERTLCSPCPTCNGSGHLKSVVSVILDILDEARKMAPDMDPQKDVTLRVNPEVARTLKSRRNSYLQEIEESLKSHVLVRSDLALLREHFDIN